MNISNNWLRQYVDHDLPVNELGERLTMLGLEVEGIDCQGSDLEGILVGKVINVRVHPNADRLVLCDVSLGKRDPVQIICGAPNVSPGLLVPVATVGTTISNGEETLTVRDANIRGEASHGMICSEAELGLSDDHEGIMILDDDANPGEKFATYLRQRSTSPADAVFDIDITPNRPDATSHIGVARDVAAWTGTPLTRPDVTLPGDDGEASEAISIDLRAPAACPRYVAMVVKDVTVEQSPLWLRRRLTSIGLRPRNNIVDITNFVMHECGQPLHAFDLYQLAGPKIVVRTATEETAFVTLDDNERNVPAGSLLICDADRPVALAGIMGGANSEVSDETTSILIESAYFDPSTIRRTAKALDLSTDSSYRYERGIDTQIQRWAAARAAALIADIAGGSIVPGAVEETGDLPEKPVVTLRPGRANQMLGTQLKSGEMTDILSSLGFDVQTRKNQLNCVVPTFRPDITREVDLIEEIGRLYGYDAISPPDSISVPATVPASLPGRDIRTTTRNGLKGSGLREVYTNTMLPIEEADTFNAPELQGGISSGPIVQTLKPISQQMAALRPSLLPGLLQTMNHNRNHGQEALRFFEFGHVFRRSERSDTTIRGYAEHESLLVAVSGPRTPVRWSEARTKSDIFDLKGLLSEVFQELDLDARFTPTDRTHDLTTFQVDIFSDETPVGVLFQLSPETAQSYDLDASPVLIAELDWSTITALATEKQDKRYEPISRHPVVERDLALVIPDDQPIGPLLDAIKDAGAPLLQTVDVFDLYTGEHLPENSKSIAFALRLGADRTLTDEEIDKVLEHILRRVRSNFSAELRQ